LFTQQNTASGVSFGAPFALLAVCDGIYVLLVRYWVDAFWRRGTHYGVTSERVVVVTAWRGQVAVRSLALSLVGEAKATIYPNGGGLIEFGSAPSPYYTGGLVLPNYGGVQPVLEREADARAVFEIVRDQQRSHANPV
jgi:hypothetical protein